MVKDSSLVSVLGVPDITQLGKVTAAGNFRYFETYNVVAPDLPDHDGRRCRWSCGGWNSACAAVRGPSARPTHWQPGRAGD